MFDDASLFGFGLDESGFVGQFGFERFGDFIVDIVFGESNDGDVERASSVGT